MTTTPAPAITDGRCTKCNTWVRWADGRYGRYLQETTAPYDNGVRYGRGPHLREVCEDRVAKAEAADAARAAREAEEAARAASINARAARLDDALAQGRDALVEVLMADLAMDRAAAEAAADRWAATA